jgi:hypothetical protein
LDNKTNRKGAVIMTKYRIEEQIQAAQAVMAAKEPPSPSRSTLKNERELELGEGSVRAD